MTPEDVSKLRRWTKRFGGAGWMGEERRLCGALEEAWKERDKARAALAKVAGIMADANGMEDHQPGMAVVLAAITRNIIVSLRDDLHHALAAHERCKAVLRDILDCGVADVPGRHGYSLEDALNERAEREVQG